MRERDMVLRLVRGALIRISTIEQRVADLEIAQLEQAAMSAESADAIADLTKAQEILNGGTP